MTGLAPLAGTRPGDGALETRLAGAALDSLVALALRRSPELQVSAYAVQAAAEEAPAAGALPDPMIGLSARGEDYPGAGIGSDPMAMAALEVSQAFPWPGKRALREAAAAARVPELAAAHDGDRRLVAADVREAYAELYARRQAVISLREEMNLLDVLEPQALARYGTGSGTQDDWLALRRERATLASAVDRELAGRELVVARLAAALDDTAAASAVRADVLPPWSTTTPAAGIGEGFADVARAEAGLEAARIRRTAAEREGRPDLVVGAEYGWRDALPPMVTARVGVAVPLWRGRKQDAVARAAAQAEAGARAAARQTRLRADAEVRALVARQQAADRAAGRLRDRILPLLAMTAESARVRYLAGEAPADLLIAALREQADARAELAREEAAGFAAASRLRALAGLDPVAGNGREP